MIIGIIIGLIGVVFAFFQWKDGKTIKSQNEELKKQIASFDKKFEAKLDVLIEKKEITKEQKALIIKESKIAYAVKSQFDVQIQDQRFKDCLHEYEQRGTPKFLIDSYTDLSQEQKAELFDKAMKYIRERKNTEYKSENNPYRK